MKKTKLIFVILTLLLVSVFLLDGCLASDSPSASVKKAFAAAEKDNWDEFKEYATNDYGVSGVMIDFMRRFLESNGGLKKIISETTNGDQATVKATFEKGKDYDFNLIKHNGIWKIYFKY